MNFLWRAVSSVVFVLSGLFLFGEKVEVNQLVGSFLVSLEGSD